MHQPYLMIPLFSLSFKPEKHFATLSYRKAFMHLEKKGIYTFTSENIVLLCNIPISASIEPGCGGYAIVAVSWFSYFTLLDFNNSNIPKMLWSIS